MAYVGFKRGLQANLPTQQSDMQDGYFYLTSDTNRLYVCKDNQGTKQLVELNQSITSVTTMGQLPTGTSTQAIGQFYYVTHDNVLCVYTASGWVQINPDTALVANSQNTVIATVTDGVSVTSTVEDTTTPNPNQSIGSFNVVGGGVISVQKGTGNEIVISAPQGIDTQYDLTAATVTGTGASISLTNKGDATDKDTITFAGGTNVQVTQSSGTITITGPDEIASSDVAFNAAGALSVNTSVDSITGQAGNTVTPHIRYGKTADATPVTYGTDAVFANGTANLDIYTTGQVDALVNSKLQAADAMTYKGAVSSAAALTGKTNVQQGDTYKADTAFTLGSVDVHVGDLLIFKGPDGATNNTSAWDVIPSGDDQLITVSSNGTTKRFDINDNGTSIGGLTFAAGTHAAVTAVASNSNKDLTVTIGQATDYTAQTATGTTTATSLDAASAPATPTTATFTAVTGIQTDTYGNVVDGSITTAQLTVTDSHANIDSVTNTVSTTNNVATVTTTVIDTDTASDNDSFSITSGNFTVASANKQISISLEWGSF